MAKVDVGDLSELADGQIKSVQLGVSQAIIISRHKDEVFAVDGICPHRGAMLAQGAVFGNAVVCPWHDWAFDLKTGAGLTNPMSRLACFQVSVENNRITIDLPDGDCPE